MNDAYAVIVEWWRGKKIQTEAELAEVLNGHGVLFAYNSGKLENERVTWRDTREIFAHDGVSGYTGDLRTLFEIRNAKSAYEFFLTAFGKQRPLDEAFLLRLQKLLTRNTYDARRYALGERPGTWKLHDYVTGRHETGAAPSDTAEEVGELLDELRDLPPTLPPEKILTAAAYFHAKLENIHPFADGNGRAGRLAMNYFLVLRDCPPIVIHEDDRAAYYSALEAWDAAQKLEPMREFLEAQAVRAWGGRVAAPESHSPRLNDFL